MNRCGVILCWTVAVTACSTSNSATPSSPSASQVTAAPACIPLLAQTGFSLPAGWSGERRDRGSWVLSLSALGEPDAASVHADRVDTCRPASSPEPPLDPAFPEGYRVDTMSGGVATSGGVSKSTAACVHGDSGALQVTVFGYAEVLRPQIRAMLIAIAEATDGQHACPLR